MALQMIITTAARCLVASGAGISIYPTLREGARTILGDARWMYNYFTRFATELSEPLDVAPPTQAPLAAWVLSETGDVGNRVQSLFSATTIVLEAIKIYQAEQIRRELKGIADQLRIHNNLVAGGGGGPDGFARNVLDFLNLKVAGYTSDDKQHHFFIYHPDTHWHGAFARIRQESGSEQPLLLGLSNDLFAVFRLMLCARVALEAEIGDGTKNVTFHLLIPSYCTLVIPRSFVVLGNLLPLTIDGQIAQGERLVWLNLPQRDGYNRLVLNNVGNLDDLPDFSGKDLAMTGAMVTMMGAFPLATAALAIAFPPLAATIGLIGFFSSSIGTLSAMTAVEIAWEEPPPALLG